MRHDRDIRRIIVAVTGASGAIYARQLLERLVALGRIEQVALVVSRNGAAVAGHEGVAFPVHGKIVRFEVDDMFAPVASGSAGWDAMVVVPCSMGTLGRIAAGVSGDLIGRAADVMLKERRELVLVARETPLGLIHLRNMTTLTEAGAVILPAAPGFYAQPRDIDQLCSSVTDRVLSVLGLSAPAFRWGE